MYIILSISQIVKNSFIYITNSDKLADMFEQKLQPSRFCIPI
jgi:hypothetical protein